MALSKLVSTNLQGMSTKVDEKLNKQSQITSAQDVNPVGNCAECMFSSNGACTAESCIFAELPPMTMSKTAKCPMCGEETSISPYANGEFVLCKKCKKKLQNATNGSCIICGSGLADDETVICKKCAEKVNDRVIIDSKTCIICGSSFNGTSDICVTCSAKIKEKINE